MTNENGVASFLIQFFIPLKNANHDKSFDYNCSVGTFLLQQPDNKSFFREREQPSALAELDQPLT